jgi:hypothetical protein
LNSKKEVFPILPERLLKQASKEMAQMKDPYEYVRTQLGKDMLFGVAAFVSLLHVNGQQHLADAFLDNLVCHLKLTEIARRKYGKNRKLLSSVKVKTCILLESLRAACSDVMGEPCENSRLANWLLDGVV